MPAPPVVDDLRAGDSAPLGYLLGADEVVQVDSPSHGRGDAIGRSACGNTNATTLALWARPVAPSPFGEESARVELPPGTAVLAAPPVRRPQPRLGPCLVGLEVGIAVRARHRLRVAPGYDRALGRFKRETLRADSIGMNKAQRVGVLAAVLLVGAALAFTLAPFTAHRPMYISAPETSSWDSGFRAAAGSAGARSPKRSETVPRTRPWRSTAPTRGQATRRAATSPTGDGSCQPRSQGPRSWRSFSCSCCIEHRNGSR